MTFLLFLSRHLKFFVFFLLIGTTLGVVFTQTLTPFSETTTIFTTITTSNNEDPRAAEQASTDFGETVTGWFRNPAFVQEIEKKSSQQGTLSAKKQERQNLLIIAKTKTAGTSKEFAQQALKKTQNEIKRINQSSSSQFTIINQGSSTATKTPSPLFAGIIGGIGGITLALFLAILFEFLGGRVSSLQQAEEILQTETLETIPRRWTDQDLSLLSLAIQKSKNLTILAGVETNIEIISISLAHKMSLSKNTIQLVDADLTKRDLQTFLGLSTRIKNLKGHTDFTGKERSFNQFLQNTLTENMLFLPAGSGDTYSFDVLTKISQKAQTILSTHIPENIDILRCTDAALFVVVRLGKTKEETLRRIHAAWEGEIHLVVIQ